MKNCEIGEGMLVMALLPHPLMGINIRANTVFTKCAACKR